MMKCLSANRTGCIVGDTVVVLDQSTSRYLCLIRNDTPVVHRHAMSRHSIVLGWDDGVPLSLETASAHRTLRATRADSRSTDHADMLSLMRLRWLEARYGVALRRGLSAGISILPPLANAITDAHAVRKLTGSSWLARRLWSSRDRCLPRSLALTHALRASGSAARLVLGVALNPFTAHAWVQDGDRVVNDTLDHAALFTPILVT